MLQRFSIQLKLIALFVVIKVIPLIIVVYIAFEGTKALNNYLTDSTNYLFNQSKEVILDTANASINDSIKNLNKKSQESLERLSYEIANNIASFLYQRDDDILLLSKLPINQKLLQDFYNSKKRDIVVHGKYLYNDEKKIYENSNKEVFEIKKMQKATLKDNEKEFNYINPKKLKTKKIPIYKEINYFDLKGNEIYKVSTLNKNLLDISKKKNTYIKAEDYFQKIQNLKKGEIYIANLVGKSVKTNIVGTFTKEKAQKIGIKFEPKNHAYAGLENPLGKKFEGIIRFITPVYKNEKKVAYVSLALNHEHLMQFTDTTNPTKKEAKQEIADASDGNYAFMWDFKGRNISHPRDYFILGFDEETGKRSKPWLSKDVYEKFEKSDKSMEEFLKTYPKYEKQSLEKKPNINQLIKDGSIGLDCRYLNFAPQCEGWRQVTKDGGYGSFIIFWSGVWKLSTAASIPYYTGNYKNSKRGFGIVTIGANVDEFHQAANKTKRNVRKILQKQTKHMKEIVQENTFEINEFIKSLVNELTFVTFLMVVFVIAIAVWMSRYISSKIENLLLGTQKFAKNDFDYKIKVTSNDEIGNLEKSFNNMANKIKTLLKEQKDLNINLEQRVLDKTKQLQKMNIKLEERVKQEVQKSREKDLHLIQQSKLASVGEMISMIIHQWKQPLNAIGMITSSVDLKLQINSYEEDEIKKDNEVIKKQASLMLETIDEFRGFFKEKKICEYNVNSIIKKSLFLLEDIYKSLGIFIKYECEDKSLNTYGFENELTQVLINILNNARDVILEKSDCLKQINVKLYKNEENIFIEICDFAGGVDEKIINKLFEPYFTTKSDDKGTGLGLYMCKYILNRVDGKIQVLNFTKKLEKHKLKGAKFIITLKNKKG